jgi:hypothetical protein
MASRLAPALGLQARPTTSELAVQPYNMKREGETILPWLVKYLNPILTILLKSLGFLCKLNHFSESLV